MKITDARELSNVALVGEVTRLASRERAATVAFIVHIAEFDARRLHAEAGFSSAYRYCIEILHLSEDAAWNRIDAGRAARAYPVILEMLVAGTLSPTTARMLRPHLTPQNHRELLAAAAGKSKREVEALLAGRFPLPDVASVVRPLGPRVMPEVSARTTVEPGATSALETPSDALLPADAYASAPMLAAPPAAPPTPPPALAQRFEIRFTAAAETAALLRRAQDLLTGTTSGDLDRVFSRALALLVADLERKKAATTDRPRTTSALIQASQEAPRPGSPHPESRLPDSRSPESRVPDSPFPKSRYLPAAVRRAVWRRDDGRCTFVASDARRCAARRDLEFHHGPVPFAVGGRPVVENIHLLCRAHNRLESERFYGPGREYGGVGAEHGGVDVKGKVGARAFTRSGTCEAVTTA